MGGAFPLYSYSLSGSNSAVECDLAKVEVAGSNPVSRSKIPRFRQWTFSARDATLLCGKARYPSGKGEVCKTFMRRFDPGPRLQLLPSISIISCKLDWLSPFVPVRPELVKIGPI